MTLHARIILFVATIATYAIITCALATVSSAADAPLPVMASYSVKHHKIHTKHHHYHAPRLEVIPAPSHIAYNNPEFVAWMGAQIVRLRQTCGCQ